jgi:glycosyltransferase involved in cell wall biosynthesis
MRVLFVTNFYPPAPYGWGYMQLCEEVADGLFEEGHTVAVLTSTYGSDEETQHHPYPVHRRLHLDPDWQRGAPGMWQFFVGRRQRARHGVSELQRLVSAFAPDVIFIWHYIGLSREILQAAERMTEIPTVYYLAAYHPELPEEYAAFWRTPPVHPLAKLVKPVLRPYALSMLRQEGKPIRLRYDNVICVSDYVRERLVRKDLISPDAVTIHNGVDLHQFAPRQEGRNRAAQGFRSVVAGNLKHEKGVHTVIEALAHLKREQRLDGITLSLVGGGPAAYRAFLKNLVKEHGLSPTVEFRGQVPREQMPPILRQYNTLILPSEYDEPLARSMQEAMAMGLLVIGTTTGGSGELLKHQKTGLAFRAGDALSLAKQLNYAKDHPAEMERYARAGQQEVEAHFNIERTIEQIEDYLKHVLDTQRGHSVSGGRS